MSAYWHKQEHDKPLFSELQWSKPENRAHAGKLLIVGGNAHGFSAPAQAYQESLAAGIGVVKVLIPDALHKVVGQHLIVAEFAASTPSGSFSRAALSELLALSDWSDGVIVAGELGRNSETAVLLESFLGKYSGLLTLTRDSVEYFYHVADRLVQRPDTLLVISFAQLQKLIMNAKFPQAVTFNMDLLRLIDILHVFTAQYPIQIVVKHLETFVVASSGQVSTTKLQDDLPIWRVKTATHASVWWLQHRNKPFEAITASILS
jgi:ADP-dependent NAD(P)H-hydrate dehydratase / NAD(P)H-hydrate epimerase